MKNVKAPIGAMARAAANYQAWLAKRPARGVLVPAVAALLAAGRLPALDAEWIARLRPDSQLAAAKKMMKNAPITFTQTRCDRSVISHGHPGSRSF